MREIYFWGSYKIIQWQNVDNNGPFMEKLNDVGQSNYENVHIVRINLGSRYDLILLEQKTHFPQNCLSNQLCCRLGLPT